MATIYNSIDTILISYECIMYLTILICLIYTTLHFIVYQTLNTYFNLGYDPFIFYLNNMYSVKRN